MDDQVIGLKDVGVKAERVHSRMPDEIEEKSGKILKMRHKDFVYLS